jgi:hypothetical protein
LTFLNNPSLISTAAVEPGGAGEVSEQAPNAVDEWRKVAFLDPKYRVTRRVWPVEISLLPGIALSDDGGMKPADAEDAITSFLNGDGHYHDVVEELLETSVGITLRLPGDITAAIVAEAFFERCVEIGEPRLISELPVLV